MTTSFSKNSLWGTDSSKSWKFPADSLAGDPRLMETGYAGKPVVPVGSATSLELEAFVEFP